MSSNLKPCTHWPAGSDVQPLAEFVLDGRDGGLGAVGGHDVADAAVQDVNVGVNEPGQYGLAVQVKNFRIWAHPVGHVVGAAHRGKPAVQHGQRPGPGADCCQW